MEVLYRVTSKMIEKMKWYNGSLLEFELYEL